MEFEKKTEKFSFGIGSVKTAGAGSVDKAVEAPKISVKHDAKAIAKSVGNAAIALAALKVKSNIKKKKAKK